MKVNWDSVKDKVGKFAPVLGLALGGPAGGTVGKLLGSVLGTDDNPDNISAALDSADDATKARILELQENNRHELETMVLQKEIEEVKAGSQDISSVNATMRTEAAQGHPWSGAWRPFWGFVSAIAFILVVIGILVIMGWCIVNGDVNFFKEMPGIVVAIFQLFLIPGSILGVASWHRGKKQRIEAGEDQSSSVFQTLLNGMKKG